MRSLPGTLLAAGAVVAACVALSAAAAPPRAAIVIDSPRDGSVFYSAVRLRGHLSGPTEQVRALQWSIDAADRRGGVLSADADGTFDETIPLDGLHANFTLTVTASLDAGGILRTSVRLVDRRAGPALYFQSPAGGSMYASAVRVTGQVRGPVELENPLGEVAALTWSVDGSPAGGSLPFGADGGFDFSFSTVGLRGPLSVTVSGTDRNGHVSSATLALKDRPSGPPLRVEQPADAAPYGAAVAVSGRAGDSHDPSASPREVKTITWRLAEEPTRTGTVPRQRDGSFSFSLPTEGLSGPQTLQVTAQDRNGRTTTVSVRLVGPAGAVAVTPAVPEPAPPPVSRGEAPGVPPSLALSSPAAGGFYKDITVVEGRVGVASGTTLKSFGYDVTGHDRSGRVAADARGAFKLPLDMSGISGDVTVVFTVEDAAGARSQATLPLHDGRLKPSITLESPAASGGSYGSAIRVAGKVTDPYAGLPGMAGIDSATWLLSPVTLSRSSTPARGTLSLDASGSFRLTLPTTGLRGAQDLALTVTSRTGNRADLSVRLAQGDGDLPSFQVLPGDGSATATWDAIPFATRYDLMWVPGDGSPAAGKIMPGVSAPARVTGLQNGSEYSLQVKATFDDGSTGLSPVTHFVPLAGDTLGLKAASAYQEIRLSWKSIPGASVFDVWRSSKHVPTPRKISSALAGTAYADQSVEYGTEYSYTVTPSAILSPQSAPARARSLAFPAEKLAVLGEAPFSHARATSLNGGYVFVASGTQGVRVVDVSSPTAPVTVAEIPTTDAWDVAVRGAYAYVADGEAGLRVYDITEPRHPIEIGQRKTSSAHAVVLSDKYAYVADGDKGLKVIDVSNAQELPRVGAVETQNAQDLQLIEGRLYVADGGGGLKVFDISRPAAPRLAATLSTTDARQVAAEGHVAVVADGAGGLRVLDVSAPAAPSLLASLGMKMAVAVDLDLGFAYVTDGASQLTVINLEDPARPSVFVTQPAAGASGVSVRDRMAYLATQAGLEVVRVQIIGRSFPVAVCRAAGRSYDVAVSGPWAYVASHGDGIHVVDAAEPGEISDGSLTSGLGTRFAQSVAVQGRYAYVADGTSGVRIIDVSPAWTNGGLPVTTGSYRPGGDVSRAVPSGKYLYVAAGEAGLQVLDVSTPSAPAPVASLRSTDASDVVLRDSWAFLADGSGGVKVLDVTNPAAPVMLPATLKMDARRLALQGRLLLAAGSAGVSLIDVADPRTPRLLALYATDSAQSVDVSNGYAYVAEGYRGLTVLDISQPTHPAVVSTCDSVYASGVAVSGTYALVADSQGLRVVQILIPSWLQR